MTHLLPFLSTRRVMETLTLYRYYPGFNLISSVQTLLDSTAVLWSIRLFWMYQKEGISNQWGSLASALHMGGFCLDR